VLKVETAMTISIQCVHCHKRYNAPAAMAGKKVKCKHCGKIFEIPANAPQAGDTAAGERAQESVAPVTAPGKSRTPAGVSKSSASTAGKLGHPGAGFSTKIERTGAAQTLDFAENSAAVVMLRPNVPMDFPGADTLDRLAPLLMIVVGLAWLTLTAFQQNTTGFGWVSLVRFVAFMALSAGVMFPLGYWAIRSAARKHRFMLPPTPTLRAFAAFALAFTVPIAFWQASGSATLLIFGACLGLIMACGSVWFLFRIQSPEMNTTMSHTAMAFVVSVAIAYFGLLGINSIFASVAKRSGTNQLASSPMGPFEWDVPVGAAQESKKHSPTIALLPDTQPATQESPTTTTTKPSNQTIIVDVPKSTEPVTPPTDAPTTTPTTTPPPVVKSTSPPVVPTPPPPATTTHVTDVTEATSPLVAKISIISELEAGTQLIFPPGPGAVAVAVKADANGENVQFFSGNPLAKKAETKFEVESGVPQHYCLSANGDTLARLVSFPKVAVQLWNVPTNKETRVVPLDPSRGVPELLGFGWNDTLVILWNKRNMPDIEVINAKAANPQTVAFLRLKSFDLSPCNPTISTDGRQMAVAAYLNEKGGIDLWDLTSTRKAELRTCWIPLSTWAPPAGVAYGPAGATLAAFFEVSGKGILYNFRTGDATLLHEHPYRTLPYPAGAAADFTGRTLDYLDANDWLLLGRAVIDVDSGKVLGDLQIENPHAQRIVDKETVLLQTQPSEGKGYLLQVKLKPDVIQSKRAEARGIKAKP
jgi:hypothetical protein